VDRARVDARAYPLLAPLGSLPPVHLAAAQLDPLLDDTLELAHRLAAAGNPLTLHVYDGVVHGFLSFTRMVGKARMALARAGRFAAECVAQG
jgi:acetyl esterase